MYGSYGCDFFASFVIGTRIHCFVQSHVWTLKCRYLRNLQIICWLLLVTSHTVLNSKNVVRRILVETSHAWCLCISSVFASRPNLGWHTTPIQMFFTDWWHNHPVTSFEVCVIRRQSIAFRLRRYRSAGTAGWSERRSNDQLSGTNEIPGDSWGLIWLNWFEPTKNEVEYSGEIVGIHWFVNLSRKVALTMPQTIGVTPLSDTSILRCHCCLLKPLHQPGVTSVGPCPTVWTVLNLVVPARRSHLNLDEPIRSLLRTIHIVLVVSVVAGLTPLTSTWFKIFCWPIGSKKHEFLAGCLWLLLSNRDGLGQW